VTKGSLGQVKIFHFTPILNVRHVQNNERLAKCAGAIFQTILMSNLFSAIFFSNIERAITSAELSAIFH